MKTRFVLTTLALVAVVWLATACGAPPTPTPIPSPTLAPLPTALPPTATRVVPTSTPTRAATATTAPPTATSLPPTRTPVPVGSVPTVPPQPTARPVSPPTGTIVYHAITDAQSRLFHVDPNSGAVTPYLSAGSGMDLTLDNFGTNARLGEFSTGNAKFAYVFAAQPGAVNVLRLRDTAGNTRDITSDIGLSSPSWSPDFKRLAMIRQATNGWFISMIDEDGKNREDVPMPAELAGAQFRGGMSWSKTNLMVFAANTSGASDIFTNYPDGKQLRRLTDHPADDTTPVFSPDGKLIAFTSTRDGRGQIYVMNADGSGLRRVRPSTSNDFSPTWSPDGNWIAFASNNNSGTSIFIMDINGAHVRQLAGGDHPVWTR
ncbi:MAG: PD40 domain-containing protein [Chloroflexi bacterium]|nr:PD40 domain-containing protein [Chloroflexota bacterium]